MQLSKWIKRLRREATANPKKAAVLGLLLVVALWFWAPLLRNWIGKNEPSGTTAVKPTAGAPATPPPNTDGKPPAGLTQEKAATFAWEEWNKAIDLDPRTKPRKDLASLRDPFHPVRQVVVAKETKKHVEPIRVTTSPASLNMQLTSTVVGPSPRLAAINGKVYKEGETIAIGKDGRKAAFTLVEVRAGQVVLSSQGERFELNLAPKKRTGRLELSSSQK